MKTHQLKTWPKPFAAIHDGLKRHEVRKNDRGFEAGDRVELLEYDPTESQGRPVGFTGEAIFAVIGYVSKGGEWGLPPDLCVFSLLNVRVR